MSRLDDALQAALAAEHQAVFGYGVLGPHLAPADRPAAYDFVAAHQTLRDATAAAVAAGELVPVAPRADYPALYPVGDAKAALRLALRLENDCARAWRYLYLQAASSGPSTRTSQLRRSAQAALTASAVRGVRWRERLTPAHPATAFPGL